MIRSSILGLALGFAISGQSWAQDYPMVWHLQGTDQNPIYVQIIVTACPLPKDMKRLPKSNNYSGDVFEPAYGDVPGDHKSMTREERIAYFKQEGCVEVPIPMEYAQSTAELTMAACATKQGYLIAMQFLEQAAEHKKAHPYVGQWVCIPSDEPFVGVTNQ